MKTQAEALKAMYDAQTAAYQSKKAMYDAEAAARTSSNGAVTGQTAITGTVQAGADGPKAEAVLMVSRAALSAANKVRDELTPVLSVEPYKSQSVLIITSEDQLASAASATFDIRRAVLKAQLDAAHARFLLVVSQDYVPPPARPAAHGNQNRFAFLPALSVADEVIGDITKIGSWFQSDYSFGQVTVDTTSDLYAAAIVKSFQDGRIHPSFYSATHIVTAEVPNLIADLTALQTSYTQAVTDQTIATKAALDRRAQAADDKPNSTKLLAAAGRYEAFAASTGKIIDACDAVMTALFTETADKPAPIVKIAQEREVQRRLSGNPIVLLVTGKPVAAYYTKKNLWTFLGGPPLYTMGGANIEYKLFEPGSGLVVAYGVVPEHGGYRSVDKVESLFAGKSGK